MSDYNPPSAIFFDWDGTLVDSYAFLEQAHNHTRTVLGLKPLGSGEFKNHFGGPREVLYRTLYGEQAGRAKTVFQDYYMTNHISSLKVIKGAQKVIDAVIKRALPAGIVTNKKGSLVRAEINHLGWTRHFKSVVGAGEACADKPSAAPLLLAKERAEVKSDNASIWFVGDTVNDMECANAAGCPFFLIDHENTFRDDDPKMARRFKNLSEFQEFLLQSD